MFMYANHVGDSQSGFTPFTLINVNDKYLCILKFRKYEYTNILCSVIIRANSFSKRRSFLLRAATSATIFECHRIFFTRDLFSETETFS